MAMSDMASQLESLLDAIEAVSLQFLYAVIALELLILWVRKKWSAKKESVVSVIAFNLGVVPYDLFFAVMQYELMVWMYDHARIMTLGDAWYVWVLAYVLYDLAWWVVHFAAHKVRFLWCIHGAHHTPTEMNMSVAIRGSLLDFVQYVHLMIWLPILGFHPLMVLIVNVTARLYGLFTHLHKDLVPRTPLLDGILITPSLHHVHHAKNPSYIDTNYANMFSFWDKLFGTFQLELKEEPPVFGVTDPGVNAKSVISIQLGIWQNMFADMRATPRWSEKLRYLIMPPDWRPRAEAPARIATGASEAA
jgi:sterol desaturase/sphingolipid hydroxylase (fatty acid hydroxylase superfamily)